MSTVHMDNRHTTLCHVDRCLQCRDGSHRRPTSRTRSHAVSSRLSSLRLTGWLLVVMVFVVLFCVLCGISFCSTHCVSNLFKADLFYTIKIICLAFNCNLKFCFFMGALTTFNCPVHMMNSGINHTQIR